MDQEHSAGHHEDPAAACFRDCLSDIQVSLKVVAEAPLDYWPTYKQAIADLIKILDILNTVYCPVF
jgi:hypothetical protein